MSSVTISIRMDNEIKQAAEALFDELGLSMSAAVNAFVRQAVREQRIPFELSAKTPNEETLMAMAEALAISKDMTAKGYTNTDELWAALDS